MVRYIVYKGKRYPIRLSYRVFKGIRTDLGDAAIAGFENLDPAVLESMLWHGLQSGHKYEGQGTLELTKEQMEDVLDECFLEFMKLIPEFFPQAKVGNLTPAPQRGEEAENSNNPL